jgi:hypothetical protein
MKFAFRSFKVLFPGKAYISKHQHSDSLLPKVRSEEKQVSIKKNSCSSLMQQNLLYFKELISGKTCVLPLEIALCGSRVFHQVRNTKMKDYWQRCKFAKFLQAKVTNIKMLFYKIS